ncbi:MAG: regulatory protein RecX [Lachnospiraceae bacterium]|nr:regulatory protein RecX [Lachnospiraceae bacterium]
MRVTAVEKLKQKKNKVFIDDEYAFMLYDRDLALYHIEEEAEIPDVQYEKILKETVIRRARQKTIALLERMDRTESEIRHRMKLDMYSDAIADEVVQWLKSLHYLDDERYAENFIRGHFTSSSRQELFAKLFAKGISKDMCARAYEVCSEESAFGSGQNSDLSDPEQEAALRTLSKKLGSKRVLTPKERMSTIGYMMRKGFRRNEIMNAFETLEISIDYTDVPEDN